MPGDSFALEAHLTPSGWFRLLGYVFGIIGRRQSRGGVRADDPSRLTQRVLLVAVAAGIAGIEIQNLVT